MTEHEWNEAKESMPWHSVSEVTVLGGEYRLLDRKGKEVPIPVMLAVMERLTAHIAKR